MRLIIVRHAQSYANILRLFQGQAEGKGITDLGKMQAEQVGKRLKNEKIDKIFVSDLKRTRMTAEYIVKFHPDVPVVYEPRLREQSFGGYEMETGDIVKPAILKSGLARHEWKPEGGESLVEVGDRILGLLNEQIREYHDETVLWVTHGGPIVCFLAYFHNDTANFRDYEPENTAVTIVEFDKEGAANIITMNSVEHLEPNLISD